MKPEPAGADKKRVGRAAVSLLGLQLGGVAILGGLTVWHLVRRGRLIRERLLPPKRVALDEPETR